MSDGRPSVWCGYYRDIVDSWPPFTREEEMAFRKKMLAEGRIKEMKDELVLRNAGLIAVYGGRWRWLYPAEDAVSIGITGLYEAADTFDFDRTDVRFSSYAGWYLRKAFNYRKDDYRNRVDENSVSWDRPVDYTDCAGDDDSCCLGDFLSKYIDPSAVTLKSDPCAAFGFDMEEWMLGKLADSKLFGDQPLKRSRIRQVMSCRARHPEYSLERLAAECGLVNRETASPLTKERMRQIIECGKKMIRSAVRDEVAKKMASAKPDVTDFWKRYGQAAHNSERTRSRLKWNAKTRRWDTEEYVERLPPWEASSPRETAEYRVALKEWERDVDRACDDYYTELFDHRFVGGCPVKYRSKERSPTAGRNAAMIAQLMPVRRNRHASGSC